MMEIPKSIYVALFTLTASIGVVFGLIASLQDELGFADGILGLIAASAFFSQLSPLFVPQLSIAALSRDGARRVSGLRQGEHGEQPSTSRRARRTDSGRCARAGTSRGVAAKTSTISKTPTRCSRTPSHTLSAR